MSSRFPCPCCEHLTLPAASPSDVICPVCGWRDDSVDNEDTDVLGPNPVKLSRAKVNFRCLGASHPRRRGIVRPPMPDEIPPNGA